MSKKTEAKFWLASWWEHAPNVSGGKLQKSKLFFTEAEAKAMAETKMQASKRATTVSYYGLRGALIGIKTCEPKVEQKVSAKWWS